MLGFCVLGFSCISVQLRGFVTLVENGRFTTPSTIAFVVVQDTYDYYSVFDFVVIMNKSFKRI
jgi:hypothetical protein